MSKLKIIKNDNNIIVNINEISDSHLIFINIIITFMYYFIKTNKIEFCKYLKNILDIKNSNIELIKDLNTLLLKYDKKFYKIIVDMIEKNNIKVNYDSDLNNIKIQFKNQKNLIKLKEFKQDLINLIEKYIKDINNNIIKNIYNKVENIINVIYKLITNEYLRINIYNNNGNNINININNNDIENNKINELFNQKKEIGYLFIVFVIRYIYIYSKHSIYNVKQNDLYESISNMDICSLEVKNTYDMEKYLEDIQKTYTIFS